MLSIQYNQSAISRTNFNNYVLDVFNSYNNLNYYLTRVKEYNPNGRFQTEEESNEISNEIKKLLDDYGIEYKRKDGCAKSYTEIAQEIIELIKKMEDKK